LRSRISVSSGTAFFRIFRSLRATPATGSSGSSGSHRWRRVDCSDLNDGLVVGSRSHVVADEWCVEIFKGKRNRR
jgi:hypothetical protein